MGRAKSTGRARASGRIYPSHRNHRSDTNSDTLDGFGRPPGARRAKIPRVGAERVLPRLRKDRDDRSVQYRPMLALQPAQQSLYGQRRA